MKQILLQSGQPVVEEVPDPVVDAGSILVQTAFSCISSGTELATLRTVSEPLWRRALRQPDRVRQVLERVTREGLSATVRSVQDKLNTPFPIGYSAAGTVIAVGTDVTEFHVGDRVAVAGSQCAYHAEILNVPRNLAVHVPDNVDLDTASTVALGAIALQGVRRTEPALGEMVVVLGLGVLGQMTCQLLKANGCHVIACDIDPERVALAQQLGADDGVLSDVESPAAVLRRSGGMGVDAVIVTAATASNAVISQAFKMCRKKGRVVLVGDVGLNIDRNDMYVKELDFRLSCSYGPGRYDSSFEEDGHDYPFAQVRWTETRNMAEYLRLAGLGAIRLDPLMNKRFNVEDAASAYAELAQGTSGVAVSLFKYSASNAEPEHNLNLRDGAKRVAGDGRIRLAVIGAGNFFKNAHLPALRALESEIVIQAVVSRTGHNAKAIATQTGAAYASTDVNSVLKDPDVDAVLIATRHHLHGNLALRALQAGKHVLVEKPLALTGGELDAIEAFYAAGVAGKPVLLTGFNRRFSPYAGKLQELLAGRSGPLMLTYRMNAGHIPADHWVHGAEGGGRNIGEACHIYNLMTVLTGATVERVEALSVASHNGFLRPDDNFVATVRFSDGSVASLAYTAAGSSTYAKEHMEIFCDGQVYLLDDYVELRRAGDRKPLYKTASADKGLAAQWQAFCAGARNGVWPASLEEQLAASRIALAVQTQLSA
jgi:predicted dehydrogenase